MYIIMLGAPGSGKGTIGTEICDEFNLVHVATGDIFREEMKNQTELGKKAEEYISQGKLVPDEVTVGMVKSKLDKLENVLLDGFPRTIDQAKALEEYLKEKGKEITAVIDLEVPDQDIIKRTSSRVICSNKECGASYNTVFMPPKVEGICDRCGSALTKRKDDNPETIKERLDVYHKNTEPLINFYKEENKLETIDIDIYSPTTKEDTTKSAIEKIENRIK
ncbi:adenylate kinase [Clostridium sp. CAG:793]|nr:adenylate kinase [Clostridium sp. CAG:793]